jgi:hypothetical protein
MEKKLMHQQPITVIEINGFENQLFMLAGYVPVVLSLLLR